MKQEEVVQLVLIEEEENLYEIRLTDVRIGEAILNRFETCITVENIDIDEAYQGKGYGKKVVEMLKAMPGVNMLIGDSVPEALPFWARMGAIFDWGELEDLEETGHALVGFQIEWRN